jgi:hypothetical protein
MGQHPSVFGGLVCTFSYLWVSGQSPFSGAPIEWIYRFLLRIYAFLHYALSLGQPVCHSFDGKVNPACSAKNWGLPSTQYCIKRMGFRTNGAEPLIFSKK